MAKPQPPRVCHPERKHYAWGRCQKCYAKGENMKARYGITLEQVERMERDQRGRCAICLEVKPLFVDHNHRTNVVRNLLCDNCNRGIGHLMESKVRLQRAIDYLDRWR